MSYEEILSTLRSLGSPENAAGMARYGIVAREVLGVPAPRWRALARQIGQDHALAQRLWEADILETRLLAGLVDDPRQVTPEQMDRWARACDNWAVVDGCCLNLWRKTPFAYGKAVEYSAAPEEFVKRTGFVLMATLAVHDKQVPDAVFAGFLPLLEREAGDPRNFVKKAVNWALRQIGKRSRELREPAVELARKLAGSDNSGARWVGKDALRELRERPCRAEQQSCSGESDPLGESPGAADFH
jgi:3-methyladenine DNA glycosylase AlkD